MEKNMKIKLTATIIQDDENLFTAWINEIRGVIAQGETMEGVKKSLFKLLRIKLELERKANTVKQAKNVTTEEYNLVSA